MVTGFSSITPGNFWQTNGIYELTYPEDFLEIRPKCLPPDSEIRYRRLLETVKNGILILDTESGRIADANPFTGELLGYSHEHFLGKELWEICLSDEKAANEAAV